MEVTYDGNVDCCDIAMKLYSSAIAFPTSCFRALNLDPIWDTFSTLATEFSTALKADAAHSFGYCKESDFTLFGLNPTEMKTNKVAVLLLHGAGSNQAIFMPMAETLGKKEVPNVFTLNLPKVGSCCRYVREIQEEEIDAVQARIAEIKKLGAEAFVIVGHSRGALIGREVLKRDMRGANEINKVISIAHPKQSEGVIGKEYDIVARYDTVCPWRSELHVRSQTEYKTGHLGIMFSRAAHENITEEIRLSTYTD